MKYEETTEAVFISRPNRFIANVRLGDAVEVVHVKNTGRCRELLIPGCRVILARGQNPNRKTKYDLIATFKEGLGWVNIDSAAPNALVKEWLSSLPHPFSEASLIRPEYVFGKSRIDFYLEADNRRILMEVKGCTLEIDRVGYFPDAPTERGVKHLRELTAASKNGYECYIAFVIAMPEVFEVRPNTETHAEFGPALEEAMTAGVKVLFLPCSVGPDTITVNECIIK